MCFCVVVLCPASVRIVLAACVCLSLAALARALRRAFNDTAAHCFVLLTATQFHVMFYASRPLPNTFAFALGMKRQNAFVLMCDRYYFSTDDYANDHNNCCSVVLAFARWLDAHPRQCVALLIVATAVFRSELGLLAVPLLLQLLVVRQLSLRALLAVSKLSSRPRRKG